MCLLCVFEPGATPTREQLRNAADNNPHGFGYAFLVNDRIMTGRGMDADDVIDRFFRIREGFPDTWAMFHARYATHGHVDKANCHPFRVGGDPNIVLAHNGILSEVAEDKRRSDTRVFAEDELPHIIEWLDDPNGWQMLEDFARGSKIAIFSLDPRLESNVYIINEGSGHWDNGCWWSNDGYKPSRWVGNYGRFSSSLWEDDLTCNGSTGGTMSEWWKRSSEQRCIYCNAKVSDQEWNWGYCDSCKSCLECASDIIDCECYRPSMPDFDVNSIKRAGLWYEDEESVQRSLLPYNSGGW